MKTSLHILLITLITTIGCDNQVATTTPSINIDSYREKEIKNKNPLKEGELIQDTTI